MARIDRQTIPNRPGATRPVDPARSRARDTQRLHGLLDGDGAPEIERARTSQAPRDAASVLAPEADHLSALVGMSRDRMIGSLTRIEHMIARIQEREGTGGTPNEMTLARMMINEHLRRLRIVEAGEGEPSGGGR